MEDEPVIPNEILLDKTKFSNVYPPVHPGDGRVTGYTRDELIYCVFEINQKLGLSPPISVVQSTNLDLEIELTFVSRYLKPEDRFSSKTTKILQSLRVLPVPVNMTLIKMTRRATKKRKKRTNMEDTTPAMQSVFEEKKRTGTESHSYVKRDSHNILEFIQECCSKYKGLDKFNMSWKVIKGIVPVYRINTIVDLFNKYTRVDDSGECYFSEGGRAKLKELNKAYLERLRRLEYISKHGRPLDEET